MTEWIQGNASYNLQANPASEYGEEAPVVFLTLTDDTHPLQGKCVEEELSLDAAKALIEQLQNSVDAMEARHSWTTYEGKGANLKVHDLIAIADDPEFSFYVEQDDSRTFNLTFSETERLVEQLRGAMQRYRENAVNREQVACD